MMIGTRVSGPLSCLLSIVLLLVLGLIGEELLNLSRSLLPDVEDVALPVVTSMVMENYPLNAGHFVFSLSPFMLIFLGLLLIESKTGQGGSLGYLFPVTWLVAAIYICLFVLALLLPCHLLLVEMERTVVWSLVAILDAVMVFGLVALGIKGIVGARAAARGNQSDSEPQDEGGP